ncbi:MAG: hypothetical protein H6765_09395 [Candidatus Peribacteria bacterium]|nr:MAG: hypothetical protein H6765_09395 [Candidatus Peribacteria bacterium]
MFAINLVLCGYFWNNAGIVYLSLINVFALFVILFQHSDLFQRAAMKERILFSADVFTFLAVWFGLFVSFFVYPQYAHLFLNQIVSIVVFG